MNFQNVFLGVLVVGVIAAIVVFATGAGTSDSASKKAVKIAIWGEIAPRGGIQQAIAQFNTTHQETLNLSYTQIPSDTFENKFIESVADGKAPDMLIISSNRIKRLESKLSLFPYASMPLSTYESSYVDAGKVFLSPSGIAAFPALLDPIVLYWNKDMFTNASEINPPKYWDEVIALHQKLTKKGPTPGSFEQTSIALGEFSNINFAKDILSTLFMQVGVPITMRSGTGEISVSLDPQVKIPGEAPVDSALRFYTDFANPIKTLYSWNRTQPSSRDAFASEKLALYLGRASDYNTILEKNPHLNFSVALVPQMRDSKVETTFAEVYGIAVVKASKQSAAAKQALLAMLPDPDLIPLWSTESKLPPARKDLLAKPQSDALRPVLYASALRSKTWLDPQFDLTNKAFQETIEGMLSGRFSIPSAASAFLNQELSAITSKS